MTAISITSNEGALYTASAVLWVAATNPEYNQPALRIDQASKRGGAASIKVNDPNPDIEFVETDQVARAGKYEIAVQSAPDPEVSDQAEHRQFSAKYKLRVLQELERRGRSELCGPDR